MDTIKLQSWKVIFYLIIICFIRVWQQNNPLVKQVNINLQGTEQTQ